MKKKMLMYVYSDIKTDARVMRAVSSLKTEYDLTLVATNTSVNNQIVDGFSFVDYASNKKSPLKRYLHSLKVFRHQVRVVRPDIIYCHDYYAAPIAWIESKKSHVKVVYDAHELYVPDKKSSKREKICCFFEKKAITTSELVVCASNRRKEIMNKIYKTKRDIVVIDNISILPDSNKEDEIISRKPGLKEFLENETPTIVYCGAIIKARRIDKLLDAAKDLEGRVQVLIIGSGEDREHCKRHADSMRLKSIFWCDAIPYKDIKAIIKNCKIGYLYYENDTLNNANCAPNKIYEYASAGLPMIGNDNEGLNDVFGRYQIGCASNNIRTAIEDVLNNYELYQRNLNKLLEENSWEVLSLRLRTAVSEL